MSGEWIKLRSNLRTDLGVIAISAATNLDGFAVVGRLHAFWVWVSEQSRDGRLPGASRSFVDKLVGKRGFADALIAVGWLRGSDGALEIPNFERHNGTGAKARAGESERKRLQRAAPVSCPDVTGEDRPDVAGESCPDKCPDKCPDNVRTNVRTREEKSTDDDVFTSSSPRSRPGGKVRAGPDIGWEPLTGFVGVTDSDRAAWATAYPAVDVDRNLARMNEWLRSNPAKARRRSWRRFVTNWLDRQQDRGGDRPANNPKNHGTNLRNSRAFEQRNDYTAVDL